MHSNNNKWKPEYKDLIGLSENIMDGLEEEGFERDFQEVNSILMELNNEVS